MLPLGEEKSLFGVDGNPWGRNQAATSISFVGLQK